MCLRGLRGRPDLRSNLHYENGKRMSCQVNIDGIPYQEKVYQHYKLQKQEVNRFQSTHRHGSFATGMSTLPAGKETRKEACSQTLFFHLPPALSQKVATSMMARPCLMRTHCTTSQNIPSLTGYTLPVSSQVPATIRDASGR